MQSLRHQPFALTAPLALGLGIWLAEALLVAPPMPIAIAGALVLLSARLLWAHLRLVLLLWLVALACFGYARMTHRLQQADAPELQESLDYVTITGHVSDIEPRTKGVRLVLDSVSGAPVERVRITLRTPPELLESGDWLEVPASLHPLPKPVLPGAYDPSRRLRFERIGAVGYAKGKATLIPPPGNDKVSPPPEQGEARSANTSKPGGSAAGAKGPHSSEAIINSASAAIASWREYYAQTWRDTLPPDQAGVAMALTIGEQGAIPQELYDQLRDTGLTHILSISGLHMALICGLSFFVLRRALSLIPWCALHWDLKKVAGVAALAFSGLYLLLSGLPIPAVRAYVMVATVLVALLLDRPVDGPRLVMLAACALLLWSPESLMTASFQLSFAATLALVVVFQDLFSGRDPEQNPPLWQKPLRYLGASLLTSLVATLATSPFSLYHFQQVSLSGILANLIAVPWTSFTTMPLAMLSTLAPQAEWLVQLWGQSIAGLFAISQWAASWGDAVWHNAMLPTWWLGAASVAGLWSLLLHHRVRWLGAAALLALLAMAPRLGLAPQLLVSEEHAAIRLPAPVDGHRYALIGKPGSYVPDRWAQLLGEPGFTTLDCATPGQHHGLSCDPFGLTLPGHTLLWNPEPLSEECAEPGQILLWVTTNQWPNPLPCPEKTTDLSPETIEKSGGEVF